MESTYMYGGKAPLTDDFTKGTATIAIEVKKLVEREKEKSPSRAIPTAEQPVDEISRN